MSWNDAVVTNAGIALYSESLHSEGMEITRATGGYSTVPAAQLTTQTKVTAPQIPLPVAGIKEFENGRQVELRITNTGLKTAYTLRQIGIFARNKDTLKEVLLALIQDETGVVIPSEEENPEFILEFGFLLPFSNELKINAVLDPNVLITLNDLTMQLKNRSNIFMDINEPTEWFDGDWWYEETEEAETLQLLEVETIHFDETRLFHIETADGTETIVNVTDNEETATENELIIV